MIQAVTARASYGRDVTNEHTTALIMPFFIALFYAITLTSLPLEIFLDRENYLTYAASSEQILERYYRESIVFLITNEPFWLIINSTLNDFVSPENVVRSIIFFSSFFTCYVVLINNKRNIFLILLFLLIPQILKNNIIHIRQGLAVSIFIIGYYAKYRPVKYISFFMSAFVHSTFFILGFIFLLVRFIGLLNLPPYIRIAIFFVISLIFAYYINFFAIGLGARQGEFYEAAALEGSGLAFVFWIFILPLFVSQGSNYLRENAFPLSCLIFYITSYFVTPLAPRIFECTILIVLISGLNLGGLRRQVFVQAVVFYTLFSYFSRSTQPWFGWATE